MFDINAAAVALVGCSGEAEGPSVFPCGLHPKDPPIPHPSTALALPFPHPSTRARSEPGFAYHQGDGAPFAYKANLMTMTHSRMRKYINQNPKEERPGGGISVERGMKQ